MDSQTEQAFITIQNKLKNIEAMRIFGDSNSGDVELRTILVNIDVIRRRAEYIYTKGNPTVEQFVPEPITKTC